MAEDKKQAPSVPINEKLFLTSDNRLNLIIEELYEKKDGVGKGAKPSGTFAKKQISWYGKSLRSLAKTLNEDDIMESFPNLEEHKNLIEQIDKFITYLDDREQRIYEHLNKHVTLELGGYKGKVEDE